MAATYGRLTGRSGVCLATVGPGATNLTTAAAYSQLGGMPMLMITGQKGARGRHQGGFQVVDVVRMMEPITKYSRSIESAAAVPTAVREAFRRAEEERPGAVHLELPEDIATERVEGNPVKVSKWLRPVANEKSIELAAHVISQARRPLVLAGLASNRNDGVPPALRRFVSTLGMPCFTSHLGKGAVDERDPNWVGTSSVSRNDIVHSAVDEADCILSVGHDVMEKPPFVMWHDAQTVIHLNYTTAQVDPVYCPQYEVIGDVADSLQKLSDALQLCDVQWDTTRAKQSRQKLDYQFESVESDLRFPMHPLRVVHDLNNAMGPDGIVCLDNGLYKIWFARHYRTCRPASLLVDNTLATMGAGLPSAIASKIVNPTRSVVAVCGDGGFMMNSQELETAIRLEIDLLVLVLRDDAFGMIEWKRKDPLAQGFGTAFGNPSFAQYAMSYGATGHTLARAALLEPLISECFTAGGVHLIEVPIDYGIEPTLTA